MSEPQSYEEAVEAAQKAVADSGRVPGTPEATQDFLQKQDDDHRAAVEAQEEFARQIEEHHERLRAHDEELEGRTFEYDNQGNPSSVATEYDSEPERDPDLVYSREGQPVLNADDDFVEGVKDEQEAIEDSADPSEPPAGSDAAVQGENRDLEAEPEPGSDADKQTGAGALDKTAPTPGSEAADQSVTRDVFSPFDEQRDEAKERAEQGELKGSEPVVGEDQADAEDEKETPKSDTDPADDPRTVEELKEELRAQDKPVSGNKAELIERLAE